MSGTAPKLSSPNSTVSTAPSGAVSTAPSGAVSSSPSGANNSALSGTVAAGLLKVSPVSWVNEAWGGLAAMLVALPSSIAFGILVYSNLGPTYAGQGAMAGLIGACVLGVVAPFIGRTQGLISAPCGPSATVLSAFVVAMLTQATNSETISKPEFIISTMALVSLFAAVMQIFFGSIGGGSLIKFIPYQVVSGYLSGVGVLIALSQLPKLFGLAKGVSLWTGLLEPAQWQWQGLTVGLVTMIAMLLAPRFTKKLPAPIVALFSGLVSYFILAFFDSNLLNLEGNALVIGNLAVQGSVGEKLAQQWAVFTHIDWLSLKHAIVPALTLAVLLSIDTLKTCVAIDALTRSRHNSNREIVGQGVANLGCALLGGLPGAGTMGATLVNVTSGGRTPVAGLVEGFSVLLALLFLGPWLTWIPVGSLAGILLVIAFRMYDRSMFRLVLNPAGRFDFLVIISVVVVAVAFGLIAASGVGIAMSIILFIRDQIRETVILQKTTLNLISSKTQRQDSERDILQRYGSQALICKLQGNLFFGTTDQFSRTIDRDLLQARYLLLDMRRVHSLDYTAFHLLEQLNERLLEKGGQLLFSGMPSRLYEKRDFERYLAQMGLVNSPKGVLIFETFDSALEWMEEQLLKGQGVLHSESDTPMDLKDFHLFRGFTAHEIKAIEQCTSLRTVSKNGKIVHQGDLGDELFLVRKGSFRALLPLAGGRAHHIATFEQGSFFGEMAFLDHDRRSADIEAKVDAEVYLLSRSRFNEQSRAHPEIGAQVFARLALAIAQRLRHTDNELRAAEDR